MPRHFIALISIAVGLIALVAGVLAITQRTTQYTAEASVIIQPATKDPDKAIGAIDTIGRASVVSTLAQAFVGDTNVRQAFAAKGISATDASLVSVASNVVADTAVITITGSSANAQLAEKAADAVAESKPDLTGYLGPYEAKVFGIAQGTATKSGPGAGLLMFLAAFVAAGLGLLVFAGLTRLDHQGRLTGLGRLILGGGEPEELDEGQVARASRREVQQTRRRHEIEQERAARMARRSEQRSIPAPGPRGATGASGQGADGESGDGHAGAEGESASDAGGDPEPAPTVARGDVTAGPVPATPESPGDDALEDEDAMDDTQDGNLPNTPRHRPGVRGRRSGRAVR